MNKLNINDKVMELTMENLEKCFYQASVQNKKFVGIKVHMAGFPKPEVIINENANFDLKFDYYKKSYNDDLTLKSYDGIKIIGFTYGDSFNEITGDLFGDNITIQDACVPAIEFIKKHYNPHTEILVGYDTIKVTTAILGVPIKK